MTGGAATRRTRLAAGGTETRLVEAGPEGASEAVVFVHGNPGSADDWEPLVAAAGAAGVRAVAFDLPDFGETVAAEGFEHSGPGYAAFLGEALAALGIGRVHLVLHDFGGPIGLIWAIDNPDALAGAVLIDTGVLPGYSWHTLARVWRTPVLGEAFQAASRGRAFTRGLASKEPRGLPPEFLAKTAAHYDRRTKRAVLKLYRATDDPGAVGDGLAAVLAPRDLPALVIWGEHDAYLPVAYAERQREAFPSADVHVLAESGHWPFADAPEEVERLLLGYLERAASVSGASA